MSDLRCRRCGAAKSYADAMIADLERSCSVTTTVEGREVTRDARHDWTEASA